MTKLKANFGLLFVILLLPISFVFAQTGKHHRVVEIENFLKEKLEKTFISRFPESPYLINVHVQPLRTLNKDRFALDEDGLPYFEVEKSHIDEWDDPKVSNYELLSRVKTIKVSIHLPDTIGEKDISDFKTSVYGALNLISGRDEVSIFRKNWSTQPIPVNNYLFAIGILVLSLFGLWFILRFAVGKNLAKAVAAKEVVKDTEGGAGTPRAMSMPSMPSAGGGGSASVANKETLSLRLTDTLKVKTFVQEMVDKMAKNENFPCLKDMLELENLGEKHSGQLGALLMCFPVSIRRKLFAFSSGSNWLEAMYHPTEIGPEALVVLEKIERHINDDKDVLWEELLIRTWKMNEVFVDFLNTLDKKDAFNILASLPQNISIPKAREAFPGSWGILLESDTTHEKMSKESIEEIIEIAKTMDMDREESVFDIYRKDKELLKFLRHSSVQQEREVYATLPNNSMIGDIRPPFYRVLEAQEFQLDELMGLFGIEEWAIALFNVSREERKQIEGFFAPKELKVYRSFLMSFDMSPPDVENVGIIREQIAKKLEDLEQSVGLQELANEDLSVA